MEQTGERANDVDSFMAFDKAKNEWGREGWRLAETV